MTSPLDAKAKEMVKDLQEDANGLPDYSPACRNYRAAAAFILSQAERIAELSDRVHYAEGTAQANIDRAEAAEARLAELERERDDATTEIKRLRYLRTLEDGDIERMSSIANDASTRAEAAEAENAKLREALAPALLRKLNTYLFVYAGDKELAGMVEAIERALAAKGGE